MADLKFSEFTEFTSEPENFQYVGYDGIQNGRITKDNAKKALYSMMGINGFAISHDTDTDHDILFGAGSCPDSTYAMILTGSAMVKRIDASWSAGTGSGGLFSGVVAANTVYYMFVIRDDSDGSIDYGFDTDIDAANRPAGWTYYRRIRGAVITDSSSNILQFYSRKNKFFFKTHITILALGTIASSARVTLATGLPPNMEGVFFIKYYDNSNYGWVGSTYVTDFAPNATTGFRSSAYSTFELPILLDGSGNICYRGVTGGTYLGVMIKGFEDNLND